MTLLYFKTFEHDSITAGATVSGTFTAEEDVVLKRIYIARKDGIALTASTFYLIIGKMVYTREVVPASVLGPDIELTPELSIPISTPQKLDYTLKNLEGATISIFILLEIHAK